jgi:2-oxoglutarate dehydrogenase E2 component (dihydrolipoamide succinyltransferase)
MNDAVVVPRLNTNDDTYTLLEWLAEDGQEVRQGDPLVVVETSKAAEELPCPVDGVLRRLADAGVECRQGDVLARVVATGTDQSAPAPVGATTVDDAGDGPTVVLTDSARTLAEEAGVPLEQLRALGKPVVRRDDVAALLAGPAEPSGAAGAADGDRAELPRAQRAVAAVVAESHRTIPPAVAVVKVDVGAALVFARVLTRRTRTLIGLPELLIKAVAGRRPAFPMLFATGCDAASVRLAATANVGVTVDVGAGLFVPVVADAEQLSCADVADLMTEFREKAGGPGFRPAELAGANIMVALHTDPDVVLAIPIAFPGQTAVLSLAGTHEEAVPDGTGGVAFRRVCHLGLVYDHRVVNGSEAVRFLQAVKASLEAPEQ